MLTIIAGKEEHFFLFSFFVSKTSHLLLTVHPCNFIRMFTAFIGKEISIRIVILVLVLLFYLKTGGLFFHYYFSRFHKMKTRTYIKKIET